MEVGNYDFWNYIIMKLISVHKIIFVVLIAVLVIIYLVKLIKANKQMNEAQNSNDEEKMKESKKKIDILHNFRIIILIIIVLLFVASLFLDLIGPRPRYAKPVNVYENLTN